MVNAVRTEIPDFMNFRLLSINTTDELGSVFTPKTRIGRPTDVFNWVASVCVFGTITEIGMSGTRSEQNYSYKTDWKLGSKIRILGGEIFL